MVENKRIELDTFVPIVIGMDNHIHRHELPISLTENDAFIGFVAAGKTVTR